MHVAPKPVREGAKGEPSPAPAPRSGGVVTRTGPVSHGPFATAGPMVQLAPAPRLADEVQAPVQRAAPAGVVVQRAPPPELSDVLLTRTLDRMRAEGLNPEFWSDVRDYIVDEENDLGIPQGVRVAVGALHNPDQFTLEQAITTALGGTVSQGGEYQGDSAYRPILRPVLEQNAYVQSILDGTIHQAPESGTLDTTTVDPSDQTTQALSLFNKLVDRQEVLPQFAENRTWSPASSMGGNVLNLGWASPSGIVLHELGHHLEDNLNPGEFATVHNFLRARSRQDAWGISDMRPVGYEALIGRDQGSTGYDIEEPQIDVGESERSLWGLAWNGIKFLAGKLFGENWGARGIENFFINHANNQQVGYNTKVYEGRYATEYISTTIEMMNRPDTAQELVDEDPLRVALFLYVANRPVYDQVADDFAVKLGNYNNEHPGHPLPVRGLDQLIHTI